MVPLLGSKMAPFAQSIVRQLRGSSHSYRFQQVFFARGRIIFVHFQFF
jgi:hypothetical protein